MGLRDSHFYQSYNNHDTTSASPCIHKNICYNISVFKCIAAEIITCLHTSTWLNALNIKFVHLIIQLIKRANLFVCNIGDLDEQKLLMKPQSNKITNISHTNNDASDDNKNP